MKKAIILHSVSDAEHCVKSGLNREAYLFSTHSSVDVYLKEHHNITCQCLSKFLNDSEIIAIKNQSYSIVDEVLSALDATISPSINSQIDIKMNYFVPLYSYVGKYQFSGYVYFIETVNRIIDIYELEKISFYDYKFNRFFDTDTDIGHVISLFFPSLETKKIAYIRKEDCLGRTTDIIKRGPVSLLRKLLHKVSNMKYRKVSAKKKRSCCMKAYISCSF